MSDALIAAQAKKIFELETRLSWSEDALRRIHVMCVGVGGPLNDNKLGFTKEQKALFSKIDELARE